MQSKEIGGTWRKKFENLWSIQYRMVSVEKHLSICLRAALCFLPVEQQVELDRVARYKALIQRRKVVDLAQAQAHEIALLRAELERLRMRTFAALVHNNN